MQVARQEAVTAREQAARAVTEERLRIARELHDVLAHSMSLIAVQACVGGDVIRTDVDAAERALEVIAETSRTALTRTRSMLGLLRGDGDPTAAPVRAIGDLGSLVEDVRGGRVRGHPAKLLAAVDVVASGDALLAPRVTRRLTSSSSHSPRRPPTSPG